MYYTLSHHAIPCPKEYTIRVHVYFRTKLSTNDHPTLPSLIGQLIFILFCSFRFCFILLVERERLDRLEERIVLKCTDVLISSRRMSPLISWTLIYFADSVCCAIRDMHKGTRQGRKTGTLYSIKFRGWMNSVAMLAWPACFTPGPRLQSSTFPRPIRPLQASSAESGNWNQHGPNSPLV